MLFSINTSTGAAIQIGLTGLSRMSGLVSMNGNLYTYSASGDLYTLNPATAQATLINSFTNSYFPYYGMAPLTVPLAGLYPPSANAGGSAFQLSLIGAGFQSNSTVQWNGSALATTYINQNQLTASV